MRKSSAATIGTLAFLIAPAGFAVSLIIGSAAAIITAAVQSYSKAGTTDIDLMETEDFREVADEATLAGICGFILLIPNPLGVVGTVIKLGLCYIARPIWHSVIVKEGRSPNFKKHWVLFSRRVDGEVVIIRF